MPFYPGLGGGDEVLPLLRSAVKEFGINYYDDVRETNYEQHKIGGYPAFCQEPAGLLLRLPNQLR